MVILGLYHTFQMGYNVHYFCFRNVIGPKAFKRK